MRRILGLIGTLLGSVGTVLCIAAIVGIWIAQSRFIDWFARTADKAEATVERVHSNLRSANSRLKKTQSELAAVQQRTEAVDPAPKQNFLVRTIIEQNKPELREAKSKLVVASEAGLVLQGILEALADVDIGDRPETERIRAANEQLGAVLNQADLVTAKLNVVGPVDPDTSELTNGLARLIQTLDEGDARMEHVRNRAAEWRRDVHFWSRITALVITFLSLWIGLGQCCLTKDAWRWIWGKRDAAAV